MSPRESISILTESPLESADPLSSKRTGAWVGVLWWHRGCSVVSIIWSQMWRVLENTDKLETDVGLPRGVPLPMFQLDVAYGSRRDQGGFIVFSAIPWISRGSCLCWEEAKVMRYNGGAAASWMECGLTMWGCRWLEGSVRSQQTAAPEACSMEGRT